MVELEMINTKSCIYNSRMFTTTCYVIFLVNFHFPHGIDKYNPDINIILYKEIEL